MINAATPIFVLALIALCVLLASFIENTLFSSVFLCLCYILIYIAFSDKERQKSRITKRKGALMLLSFLAINYLSGLVLDLFFEIEARTLTPLSAIISVVLFPIAEELCFRKTLYKVLSKRVSSWVAILFSSLVFALLHTGIAGMISAFLAGIMLCVIYEISGSITLPVICHVSNNLLALAFQCASRG